MRVKLTVCGVVQGVGFRPFVARLAKELQIGGFVRNSGGIVTIEAYGNEEAMDKFICRLRGISGNRSSELPAGRVDQILVEMLDENKDSEIIHFRIMNSERDGIGNVPLIPTDLPVCEECLKEMKDPGNPRFRYPFISCVNCGPRYSIFEALPYDRERISMRDFQMCPECAVEYRGENNRRRHAQTISCHHCGPQLLFCKGSEFAVEDTCGKYVSKGEAALLSAIACLQNGGILALKGVGGYQLICQAGRADCVARLRIMKGREKKPFAVMFSSLVQIRERCEVSAAEERLLSSVSCPIVLLKPKCLYGGFEEVLCAESRFLGAFLPCTGLHQLLTEHCGPLVVTSANRSGDPLMTEEGQMTEWLEDRKLYPDGLIPDGIAWNTRRIITPLDDSVVRITGGKTQMLRRSRGMVPDPVMVDRAWQKPVLAFGGDLKSVFGFGVDRRFYASQYLGDLENYAVEKQLEIELQRMQQLFGIRPEVLVCDLHPGYFSNRMAKEAAEKMQLPLLTIQHHHAHAASVMAEHHLQHCLAFVFDGTGYGIDGHVWGGEFLLCTGHEYQRVGHLSEIKLCGGDTAAKDALLTAACHLIQAGVEASDMEWGERFRMAEKALHWNINAEYSSSMGRFFDAVSALLGIRMENSYEGECAVALENKAAEALEAKEEPLGPKLELREEDGCLIADRDEFIRHLAQYAGMWENKNCRRLALGFHEAIAEMVLEAGLRVRKKNGETQVVLGGGVFANVILQERCRELLEQSGFTVYVNEQLPGNDGGICLGQAWLGQYMTADEKK